MDRVMMNGNFRVASGFRIPVPSWDAACIQPGPELAVQLSGEQAASPAE